MSNHSQDTGKLFGRGSSPIRATLVDKHIIQEGPHALTFVRRPYHDHSPRVDDVAEVFEQEGHRGNPLDWVDAWRPVGIIGGTTKDVVGCSNTCINHWSEETSNVGIATIIHKA